MTNRERIEAIREREAKASKGPWEVERRHASADRCDGIRAHIDHTHPPEESCWSVDECPGQAAENIITTDSGFYGPNAEDAEFIAHSREDIPFLLELTADLRDTIKLAIGFNRMTPWHEVPDSEVDAYIQRLRELKANPRTEKLALS